MYIRDVMTKDVEVISAESSLSEAAQKMKERNIGIVPVVEGENILGVLTDRDIAIRSVADGRDPLKTVAGEVMSSGFFWCYENHDIREAAQMMRDNQVRRVIVLDHRDKIAGIVSLGDLAVELHNDKMSGSVLKGISHS